MALFHNLRLASFGAVLVFSLIVLGVSAPWVSISLASLALAVSVLTWASMLPVLLVSLLRRGSFLSWVGVELAVCGLMWILWMASAAYTTSATAGLALNCDFAYTSVYEGICRQYQALEAFSWLIWIILLAYIVLLVVFAIKASGDGRSVWTSDVTDLGSPSGVDNATTFAPSMTTANNTTPAPVTPQPYQQQQFNPTMQQHPQGVAHV